MCLINRAKRFTLIELIIVIAIIGILLTLLLPSLGKAAFSARTAVCLSNLSQNGKNTFIYTKDNNGRLMHTMTNPSKPIRAYYLRYRGNNAGLAILHDDYGTPGETFYCPQYDYEPVGRFMEVAANSLKLFTYKAYVNTYGEWGTAGKVRSGYYYLTGEAKKEAQGVTGHPLIKYENDEILFSDSTQNYNSGAHCKYRNFWNVLKMDLSAKSVYSDKTASILQANTEIFGTYKGQYELIIEELMK